MGTKYDAGEVVKEVLLISVFAVMPIFIVWAGAWEAGYRQGHAVARAYYRATSEIPSSHFVIDRDTFHLSTKYRVLEYQENEQAKGAP